MPKNWYEDLGGIPVKESVNDSESKNWYEDLGGVPVNDSSGEPEEEGSYLRMAAQVPRNLVTGAAELLDLPNMAANLALSATPIKYRFNQGYFSDLASKGVDTLTGGYTKPKTKGERVAESGARAIGNVLTGYGAGTKLASLGVQGVSKLGRGLAKINPKDPISLAATGAGGAAQQAYQEGNPDSLVGSLVTGLAADVATRGGLNLANKRKYAPTAAKILNVKPSHAESFHEMGVSPTLGQISDNPIVKSMENTLRHVGFSGKLRNDYDKQYKKMIEILGPGAQGLAQTELEAGKSLKKSMAEYSQKHRRVFSKLEKNYMDKVNKINNLVDVTDSLHFVKKLEHELQTSRGVTDFKKTPLGKEYESLNARAIQNNGAVPFLDLKRFKKKLDNMISKSEIGNVDEAELMQLKDFVNKDISDFMEGIGASKQWNRRNKYYSEFAEKRKEHLLEARTTPKNKANEIFDDMGYSGKLDRNLIDTAYATQKKTGRLQTMDSLFQKIGKKGNDQDVHLFARRLSAQDPETIDTLLSPLSAPMKKKVKAVIHSVDNIKELNTFGNPSRTAYTNAIMQAGQIGALSAYDLGRGNAPSDTAWKYAILTASSIALSRGMFANPKFVNWVIKGSKMSPKARIHHIAGIKGILGRPVYQEIRNALSGEAREK